MRRLRFRAEKFTNIELWTPKPNNEIVPTLLVIGEILGSFVSNTISAVLSGTIVAAVTIYALSGEDSRRDVEVTYSSVTYDGELGSAVANDLLKIIERSEADLSAITKKRILEDITLNSTFSMFGYIEETRITNHESDRAVEILIEGNEVDFAVVRSKSAGSVTKTESFETTVRILPKETVQVLNVKGNSFPNRFTIDGPGSDTILVSQDGVYLRPVSERTFINDVFGSYLEEFPVVFLGLLAVGFFGSFMFLLEITLLLNKRWNFLFLKNNSDIGKLALYKILLEHIKSNEPDRWKKVEDKLHKHRSEYLGVESKPPPT